METLTQSRREGLFFVKQNYNHRLQAQPSAPKALTYNNKILAFTYQLMTYSDMEPQIVKYVSLRTESCINGE